jgi:hypothetical protein
MSRRHGNAPGVNVLAGSARSFSPATIVKGPQSAANFQPSVMSRRGRSAPNVSVLTEVSQGHETNHTVHRRILANRR